MLQSTTWVSIFLFYTLTSYKSLDSNICIHPVGSLVVRMLFLPIEEVSFGLFSKLLSSGKLGKFTSLRPNGIYSVHSSNLCMLTNAEDVQSSRRVLLLILKLMVIIGKK